MFWATRAAVPERARALLPGMTPDVGGSEDYHEADAGWRIYAGVPPPWGPLRQERIRGQQEGEGQTCPCKGRNGAGSR